MKSTKETLSPTRVRLTVEVPFEELKPSLDAAYKTIAGQIKVKGFRPGHVPPVVIDRQVGREAVLSEALNPAMNAAYAEAIETQDVKPLSQPEIDLEQFEDGKELKFTAEMDCMPEFELPEYKGIELTVEPAVASEEEIDTEIGELRDRFGVLTDVDRAVADSDYVSLNIVTTIDGEEVPAGTASELSYQVGSGQLMEGLDDALIGAEAGATVTFTTDLKWGEYAGKTAEVAATVNSVKVKELPEADDEFAAMASPFDTIAELRTDTAERIARVKRFQQGYEARDKATEHLISGVEIPLPQSAIDSEVAWRRDSLEAQLGQAGLDLAGWLETQGKDEDAFVADLTEAAEESLRSQFILDKIAETEELQVTDEELTEVVVRQARQQGVAPQEFAQHVMEHGHLPGLMADALRSKAIATVLEAATITDTAGNPVDLNAASDQ